MGYRSKHDRERDQEEASRLYLQQRTLREIAEIISSERDYGITHTTVANDLKRVRKRWMEASLQHMDEWKAQELARIDKLEREAWDAWDRSIGEHIVQTEKTKPDDIETQTRSELLAGDPRYLGTVQWCVEQRCKILGLLAPQQSVGVMDARVSVDPIEEVPEDRRLELIRGCLNVMLAARTGESGGSHGTDGDHSGGSTTSGEE